LNTSTTVAILLVAAVAAAVVAHGTVAVAVAAAVAYGVHQLPIAEVPEGPVLYIELREIMSAVLPA
jgi:hypothetical protein